MAILRRHAAPLPLVVLAAVIAPCAGLSWALGPEEVQPYPAGGPSAYQFPDSAFALLADEGSSGDVMLFYSDGKTFRVSGPPPLPHGVPSPTTAVLTGGPPGSYDGNGNWMLAVARVGTSLVGFTHVENHVWECPGGYGELVPCV